MIYPVRRIAIGRGAQIVQPSNKLSRVCGSPLTNRQSGSSRFLLDRSLISDELEPQSFFLPKVLHIAIDLQPKPWSKAERKEMNFLFPNGLIGGDVRIQDPSLTKDSSAFLRIAANPLRRVSQALE